MKLISKILIVQVILLLCLFTVFPLFFFKQDQGNLDNQKILVEIPKSATAAQAVQILINNKIIKDNTKLSLLMRILKADQSIQAGSYYLQPNMSSWEIIKTIQGQGKPETRVYRSITIPEGLTIDEIATEFEKAGLGRRKEFLKTVQSVLVNPDFRTKYPFLIDIPVPSLEGYLFPDTYSIYPSENARTLINMMLRRFTEKIIPLANQQTNKYNLHQILTLASIIEKEAVNKTERPIVSSVFYNRLDYKMHLASCPTVKYALGKPHKPTLYYRDLEVKSPYNTYKHTGLPPGPICSPGVECIVAALKPAKTKYLYFAAKGDGSSIFTKNSDEHYKALRTIR